MRELIDLTPRKPSTPGPWSSLAVNVALALFAFLSAVFTGFYWWDTKKIRELNEKQFEAQQKALADQAKDVERSRVASEKSATAAERTALAFEQSTKNAQHALIIEQRPLLELVKFEMLTPHQPIFTLRNSGRTTAFHVVGTQKYEIGPWRPSRAREWFTTLRRGGEDSMLVMGNIGVGEMTRTSVPGQKEVISSIVNSLKEKSLATRFTGAFSYQDIFRKKYRLWWCYLEVPKELFSDITTPVFSVCREPNSNGSI